MATAAEGTRPAVASIEAGVWARQLPQAHRAPFIALAATSGASAFAAFAVDRAVVASILIAALVLVSAVDLERGVIPNRVVLPACAIVLALQLVLFGGRTDEWLLAPLLSALILALPSLLGRSWMGMGDAKLALLIGAGLGWGAFGAILLALLLTFPVALAVVVRGGIAARKKTLPFGPFLALGALVVLFGLHLSGLPAS